MTKKNQKPIQKFISRAITIACLAVFIYAASGLFSAFMDYYQNRKMLSNVQDTFYRVAASSNSEQDKIRSGFDELLKQNEAVVGWLTMNDTQIDYPILHSKDNIDYLTENYYGDQSRAGSIFLDYRNDITAGDLNTIVYGHRMKDGSMFQHLTKFLDEDFFYSHLNFEYDTLYDSYDAEIFSVYNTLTDFNYIETDFSTKEEYGELLEKMQSMSRFETDVQVSADDKIITLSTCDYELDQNEGRLVIHAKLVKK